MKHILKTDPAVFQAVADGAKTYEIRLNDRGYAVGDELLLRETTHTGAEIAIGATLEYTGREITKHVGHVLGGYGLKDDWVILSFAERTTSPVSKMTAHLAAIEEALKVMLDNGLSECYAYDEAVEALTSMKATPANCQDNEGEKA